MVFDSTSTFFIFPEPLKTLLPVILAYSDELSSPRPRSSLSNLRYCAQLILIYFVAAFISRGILTQLT